MQSCVIVIEYTVCGDADGLTIHHKYSFEARLLCKTYGSV